MKLRGWPILSVFLWIATAHGDDAPPCPVADAATDGPHWYRSIHCINGLSQAQPYLNPYAGNYYYRPYSYEMTLSQSREAVALGGDPSQPYDLGVFETVYRELEGPRPAVEPVKRPASPRRLP